MLRPDDFLTGGHRRWPALRTRAGPEGWQKRFCRSGAGDEQGLRCAAVRWTRPRRCARGVAFFQAVKVILTKRGSEQKKTDEEARTGDPADHRLGVVSKGGRHLRRCGPDKPNIGIPTTLPGRGAQPARAQPGGRTAGAPARRRDQVTLRQQRGAEQEVLRTCWPTWCSATRTDPSKPLQVMEEEPVEMAVPRTQRAARAGPERGRGTLLRRAG